ncbi:hypothetical protein WMY93_002335 [Mugilogobius chulae]|uniref:Uncharacterized protein n=1 Tax=Mugilogobius chulae TaxID=88201 RepID=A0AAW0PW97_9GOBI
MLTRIFNIPQLQFTRPDAPDGLCGGGVICGASCPRAEAEAADSSRVAPVVVAVVVKLASSLLLLLLSSSSARKPALNTDARKQTAHQSTRHLHASAISASSSASLPRHVSGLRVRACPGCGLLSAGIHIIRAVPGVQAPPTRMDGWTQLVRGERLAHCTRVE